MHSISRLYDHLFLLEKNKNKTHLYPIHKKLDYVKIKCNHLYEYILQHHIESDTKLNILDAGCGVGFGSIFLAERTSNQITGISLSELEIQQAYISLKQKGLTNCKFHKLSFDKIQNETFDLIICLESFKHSFDFQKTLSHFESILSPKGKIIIIDDFYTGDNAEGKHETRFKKYWNLNELLEEKQLHQTNFKIQAEDLTPFMKGFSYPLLLLKYFFTEILAVFKGYSFKKLFGGGVILEKLYAKNEMKYKLIELRLC